MTRRVSAIEAIFAFSAIQQIKKPRRTVRKSFSCWLCGKTVEAGDVALGSWHENCALGVASVIQPGVDEILASGKYKVVRQTKGSMAITPTNTRGKRA